MIIFYWPHHFLWRKWRSQYKIINTYTNLHFSTIRVGTLQFVIYKNRFVSSYKNNKYASCLHCFKRSATHKYLIFMYVFLPISSQYFDFKSKPYRWKIISHLPGHRLNYPYIKLVTRSQFLTNTHTQTHTHTHTHTHTNMRDLFVEQCQYLSQMYHPITLFMVPLLPKCRALDSGVLLHQLLEFSPILTENWNS